MIDILVRMTTSIKKGGRRRSMAHPAAESYEPNEF
jgi:hypothetical protein